MLLGAPAGSPIVDEELRQLLVDDGASPRSWPRCPTSGSSRSRGRDARRRARGVRRVPGRPARHPAVAARGAREPDEARLPVRRAALRAARGPRGVRQRRRGALLPGLRLPRAAWHVDRERLRALDPRLDIDQVCEALAFVDGVCAGDERGGAAARSRSASASASSRRRAARCSSPARSTAVSPTTPNASSSTSSTASSAEPALRVGLATQRRDRRTASRRGRRNRGQTRLRRLGGGQTGTSSTAPTA